MTEFCDVKLYSQCMFLYCRFQEHLEDWGTASTSHDSIHGSNVQAMLVVSQVTESSVPSKSPKSSLNVDTPLDKRVLNNWPVTRILSSWTSSQEHFRKEKIMCFINPLYFKSQALLYFHSQQNEEPHHWAYFSCPRNTWLNRPNPITSSSTVANTLETIIIYGHRN